MQRPGPIVLRGHEINFNHLRSFWAAAQEGSLAGAARRLHVSQPTISEQIRLLEEALAVRLLDRLPTGLTPTRVGHDVLGHAEAIFGLADQIGHLAADRLDSPTMLRVGIVETVPKRIAWRLIEPAIHGTQRVVCREASNEILVQELGLHRLDIVISDAPLPAGESPLGMNHVLGESAVAWFARQGVVPPGAWPDQMHGVRLLLPLSGPLRQRVEDWLGTLPHAPIIAGEFQDGSLMKAAGAAGAGAFPAPRALTGELARDLQCHEVAPLAGPRLRFVAITVQRGPTHPGVARILAAAGGVLDPQPNAS